MSLSEYKRDMQGCSRCSSCKWIPFNQVKSWRFSKNCPSVSRYNFHAYSGSGKMIMGLSMLENRSELNETVANVIYQCQMCGACDVACKVYRDDIDLTEVLLELRAKCVEEGELILEHMAMIDSLKIEGNTLGEPRGKRGEWADGLDVKDISSDTCEVLFHAGCRSSYDPDLRDTVRGQVRLLLSSGIDVGIARTEESCCGGRAYEIGYRGDSRNHIEDMLLRVKSSGVKTVVTPCADCYAHFQFLYPRMGMKLPVEILHISQYLDRLVTEGRLGLKHEIPLLVTYHDPCHLGRMGESFLADWTGDKLLRPVSMKRAGRTGIYDSPRKVLTAVPGLELVEMERIREYSWCCGAGGGVHEAFPEFAGWTARERIEEAIATGADALVTACPWCVRTFRDATTDRAVSLPIYDLTDLALQSAGIQEQARA